MSYKTKQKIPYKMKEADKLRNLGCQLAIQYMCPTHFVIIHKFENNPGGPTVHFPQMSPMITSSKSISHVQ